MQLFAIDAPLAASASPDKARALRTGFSLAALVLGPLWLLARGLWQAVFVYALAFAGVAVAVIWGGLAPGAALALHALAHLYLGFEGRALRLKLRARAGRSLADLIYARTALEAEKVYIERVLDAPAPARRAGVPEASAVIGLFPEPGR